MKKGIVLFLFLTVALLSYLRLDGAMDRATMYLEDGISQEQAKELLRREEEREEKTPALFFRKTVSADIKAEIFDVCGEVRLLTTSMGTLTKEDVSGCLISEALAIELFKSTKTRESEIVLEGDIYIVRGVYPSTDKQLIRLNQDEELLFNQVRVEKQKYEMAEIALQEFAMRHGLEGTVLQWVEYVGIVKGMLLLAFAALATIPWFLLKVAIWQEPRLLRQKAIIQKIFSIAYLATVVVLLGSQIHIPIEMVPAKWSDFTYWSGWFEDVRMNLSNIFLLEKFGYERSFLSFGLWSIVGSSGVLVMVMLISKEIKNYFQDAGLGKRSELFLSKLVDKSIDNH